MTDHAWLPLDDVARWCDVDLATASERDQVVVGYCRDAAAAYVEEVRPDLFIAAEDADEDAPAPSPGDNAFLGALIAARRLRERNTSGAYSEFGAAVALLPLDPDVSALLGTGMHAPPRVG